MSFDYKDLRKFQKNLENLKKNAPAVVEALTISEGLYAVKQARTITRDEKLADTGTYLRNWHTGNSETPAHEGKEYDGQPVRKKGDTYTVDVYNNIDYAKHLEFGFRSHYVPPQYLSSYYRKRFPKGMYVGTPGGYVEGHYVLRRAIRQTKVTQKARLTREWDKKIKAYIERGL